MGMAQTQTRVGVVQRLTLRIWFTVWVCLVNPTSVGVLAAWRLQAGSEEVYLEQAFSIKATC